MADFRVFGLGMFRTNQLYCTRPLKLTRIILTAKGYEKDGGGPKNHLLEAHPWFKIVISRLVIRKCVYRVSPKPVVLAYPHYVMLKRRMGR